MRPLGRGNAHVIVSKRFDETALEVVEIPESALDHGEPGKLASAAGLALRLLPERERAPIIATVLLGQCELTNEIRTEILVALHPLRKLVGGLEVARGLAIRMPLCRVPAGRPKEGDRLLIELAGIRSNEMVGELTRVGGCGGAIEFLHALRHSPMQHARTRLPELAVYRLTQEWMGEVVHDLRSIRRLDQNVRASQLRNGGEQLVRRQLAHRAQEVVRDANPDNRRQLRDGARGRRESMEASEEEIADVIREAADRRAPNRASCRRADAACRRPREI